MKYYVLSIIIIPILTHTMMPPHSAPQMRRRSSASAGLPGPADLHLALDRVRALSDAQVQEGALYSSRTRKDLQLTGVSQPQLPTARKLTPRSPSSELLARLNIFPRTAIDPQKDLRASNPDQYALLLGIYGSLYLAYIAKCKKRGDHICAESERHQERLGREYDRLRSAYTRAAQQQIASMQAAQGNSALHIYAGGAHQQLKKAEHAAEQAQSFGRVERKKKRKQRNKLFDEVTAAQSDSPRMTALNRAHQHHLAASETYAEFMERYKQAVARRQDFDRSITRMESVARILSSNGPDNDTELRIIIEKLNKVYEEAQQAFRLYLDQAYDRDLPDDAILVEADKAIRLCQHALDLLYQIEDDPTDETSERVTMLSDKAQEIRPEIARTRGRKSFAIEKKITRKAKKAGLEPPTNPLGPLEPEVTENPMPIDLYNKRLQALKAAAIDDAVGHMRHAYETACRAHGRDVEEKNPSALIGLAVSVESAPSVNEGSFEHTLQFALLCKQETALRKAYADTVYGMNASKHPDAISTADLAQFALQANDKSRDHGERLFARRVKTLQFAHKVKVLGEALDAANQAISYFNGQYRKTKEPTCLSQALQAIALRTMLTRYLNHVELDLRLNPFLRGYYESKRLEEQDARLVNTIGERGIDVARATQGETVMPTPRGFRPGWTIVDEAPSMPASPLRKGRKPHPAKGGRIKVRPKDIDHGSKKSGGSKKGKGSSKKKKKSTTKADNQERIQ